MYLGGRYIVNKEICKKIIIHSNDAYSSAAEGMCLIVVDGIISEIIQGYNLGENKYTDVTEYLQETMKSRIKKYLLTYKRNELMVVLLHLKAQFRAAISSGETLDSFNVSVRHEEILYLMNIVLNASDNEFKNRSLLDGSKNLSLSFRLGYYYHVLQDNIKHFLVEPKENTCLNEFFKEGAFYNEEMAFYLDSTLGITGVDFPEESIINSPLLQSEAVKNGFDMKSITKSVDLVIQENFKFSLSDLNDFICWGLRQGQPEFMIIMNKSEYAHLIGQDMDTIQSIIQVFSLNSLLFYNNQIGKILDPIRLIELRSIYEFDDTIIFYPFDFLYNYSCFEKFMSKNHFIDYFSIMLSQETNIKLKKSLDRIESKLSTFLAYVLIDKLQENGYILPLKKNVPYPEVQSIVVNNKNILKNSGDIDVLAFDAYRKQILNIEIKYYQPLLNMENSTSLYKREERNKNIINPMKRHKIIENNIEGVLKFLRIDSYNTGEYVVRTIFVSPRPDYWMLTTEQNSVEYIPWNKLINKITTNTL